MNFITNEMIPEGESCINEVCGAIEHGAGRLYVEFYHDDASFNIMILGCEDHHYCYCHFSPLEWRRFGQVLGKSITLLELSVEEIVGGIDDDDILTMHPEATQFMQEFYNGLKFNVSITSLRMEVFPGNMIRLQDLSHMLRHNRCLCDLELGSPGPLSHSQISTIAITLEGRELDRLAMGNICFNHEDGSLERIVSACVKVKKLQVNCPANFQYDTITTLLQNPDAMLVSLNLLDSSLSHENVCKIVTSLADNDKLKQLHGRGFSAHGDLFCPLLCDTSSIDSLVNSNHTLYLIESNPSPPLPQIVEHSLILNGMIDKDVIIRTKIALLYFEGEFNFSPFTTMPLSLLPQVIGLINQEGAGNRHAAIFRLLQSIPNFCDLSERKIEHFTSQTPKN